MRLTSWQGVKNQIRVLVYTDQISRLELLGRDESDHGQEDGLQSANGIRSDLPELISRLLD